MVLTHKPAAKSDKMAEQSISRPFIGIPSPLPWSHRAATKLYEACRRWRLRRNGRLEEPEHAIVDATQTRSGPVSSLIKLVCIADTHNSQPELPHGDILLHAGDLSQYGTFDEIQAQLQWLNSHPHKHKIIIAGNHDLLLDSAFVQSHPDRELDRHSGKRHADLDWGDVHYLQHGSVSIEVGTATSIRTVRVFGSPWTPRMGSWAFQYGSESGFTWEGSIPHDADVVLVHGPPVGHLDDGGKGCPDLLRELWRVRPRIAICGHIHAGRGHEILVFDYVQQCYDNVLFGRSNWMSSLIYLGIYTAWQALVSKTRAARGTLSGTSKKDEENQSKTTCLVNTAIAGSHRQAKARDPYVVLF